MPSSDSGRAAVWGWSERSAGDRHSSVWCRVIRIDDTKRVVEGFRNHQPHHPGAGVGPPSRAIACPSSAEEGNENIQCPAPLGERLPHSSPILVSGDPSCQPDGAPFDENIP